MNKRFITVALSLLLVIALLGMGLGLLDRVLSLYARLQEAPLFLQVAIATGALLLVCLSVMSLWWLLKSPSHKAQRPTLNEADINDRLEAARARGVNISLAEAELNQLQQRRASGELYICLFGEISAGKSSLIKALLPTAEVNTDVLGGTTQDVHRYQAEVDGAQVILADVPGVNDAHSAVAKIAREEALRAQLVVYLCDGDLSRSEWQELVALAEIGKPLVVALNKTDNYTQEQREQITGRIEYRLRSNTATKDAALVTLVTGGQQEVLVVSGDQQERRELRPRAPQLNSLLAAMNQQLAADNVDTLNTKRDQAVLAQVAARLEMAETEYQQAQAMTIVRKYTGGAVVGALAAITPGSDLVIQGVLASKMVKDLSELYGVPARDAQIDELLSLTNKKLKKSVTLSFAVAGNGFKAFPGVGTVAGGLLHAVAYGLLFDSFGRALAAVLAEKRELSAEMTANRMEDLLSSDVLPRARQLVQLALQSRDSSAQG